MNPRPRLPHSLANPFTIVLKAANAVKLAASRCTANAFRRESSAAKNVCVYSVVIRCHVSYKFIRLGKWPTSGIQAHSKKLRLGCQPNAVLAKKVNAKKTTVTALGLVSDAVSNVSVWIAKTEGIPKARVLTKGYRLK